jgi:hypothetical protein
MVNLAALGGQVPQIEECFRASARRPRIRTGHIRLSTPILVTSLWYGEKAVEAENRTPQDGVDAKAGQGFLSDFFRGVAHEIELRAFHPVSRNVLGRFFTRDPGEAVGFALKHAGANIFFGVATREGGGDKKSCREIVALWADLDFKDSSELDVWEQVLAYPLRPSLIIQSGDGLHVYWLLLDKVGAVAETVEPILRGLQRALHGDPACAELARILRLPGTVNYKYTPPRRCEILEADWRRRYRFEQFTSLAVANGKTEAKAPVDKSGGMIPEGARHRTLVSLAGTMRRRGMTAEEMEAALTAVNRRCDPPLSANEVCAIAFDIAERYGPPAEPDGSFQGASVEVNEKQSRKEDEAEPNRWPDDPDPAAYHGLGGEFVRALEPHTEASPVALLFQFLIGFGNLIGRSAHFRVEADKHYTNEFVVLVGSTSKARKGTSESWVRYLLGPCDPEWGKDKPSGLSSGEGLIWAVRDPIWKQEPIRKKHQIEGYRDLQVDKGIGDKRLHVIESEFASVLKMLEREGNTLSAVVRQAWDTGDLRSLVKNSAAKASGAHISIVGHITSDEALRYLSATEQGNGFGNRFLWVCVRRSKFLPEGGDLEACGRALAPLIEKLKAAVEFGRKAGELKRDAEAREYWREIYRDLSSGKPGLLGAMTSRAEAHTARLSNFYALLDRSLEIRGRHLEAGVSLWAYAEASCRYIFGDATGDPDADVILRTLRQTPQGMTRTKINDLFAGHSPSAVIGRALSSLFALGLVRREQQQTEGRSAELWFAV